MKSTHVRPITLLCLLLLCGAASGFAQDTIRVMTYNMLRYGAQGIGCTPTGVTARNAWLTSIMGATLPDILGVNEVGPYSGPTSPANNLLINVLQPLNPAYRGTTVTFNGSQDVANAMFYNSDKFGLAVEEVIPEPTLTLRDINYYKFYYKGPGLALGDTTFLEIVQVHLHSSDENTRQVQTEDIMNYLDGLGRSGNFIVQGDFNVDGSTAG
jgi:endonuclease/exonuclease/phosphatase family metal-dependent hydrolase